MDIRRSQVYHFGCTVREDQTRVKFRTTNLNWGQFDDPINRYGLPFPGRKEEGFQENFSRLL